MLRIRLWQRLRQHLGNVSQDAKPQPVDISIVVAKSDDGKPGGFPTKCRWSSPICAVADPGEADLRENIKALKDVLPTDVDAIYEDALVAFHEEFNLHLFCQALVARGMTKSEPERSPSIYPQRQTL